MLTATTAPARLLAGLAALLLLSALAAACAADNPNINVESNEYFRPPAPERPEPVTATNGEEEAPASQDAAEEDDGTEMAEQQAEDDSTISIDDEAGSEEQSQAEPAPAPQADDVVRRYRNPVYGYSFELVCPPFCNASANGIDEVGFGAADLRAVVAVSVYRPPADSAGDIPQRLIRDAVSISDAVDLESARSTLTTPNGVDAVLFEWDDDQRAVGGLRVHWKGWVAPIGGLFYVVRGGAADDDWDAAADAVDRVLNTFSAPIEAIAEPGAYNRFDFEIAYEPADFRAAEYGQPLDNPATSAAGALVLSDTGSVVAVLAWEEIGEAFFNAERAIERTLQDLLGVELGTGAREADQIDGRDAQTTITLTALGAGQVQIASWAWYCPQQGREFAFHYIDEDDPRAAAAPLLASFRCSVGGD